MSQSVGATTDGGPIISLRASLSFRVHSHYIGTYRFCIGPYAREYDAKMGATRTAGPPHHQGGATDAAARGHQIQAAGAGAPQLPPFHDVEDGAKAFPEGAGAVRPDRATEHGSITVAT